MIFEVPWDLIGGPGGPIPPPGGGRIFSKGGFNHLWHGLPNHTCRFSGLIFVSQTGFKTCVADNFVKTFKIFCQTASHRHFLEEKMGW